MSIPESAVPALTARLTGGVAGPSIKVYSRQGIALIRELGKVQEERMDS